MPTDKRFRTNQADRLDHPWAKMIQSHEKDAVGIVQSHPPMSPALQDNELVAKNEILGLKPGARIEDCSQRREQ